MKIERLDLTLFGSLRSVSLELARSEPCLHVVYGPNEAGKSTALRAISGLFYGIPANTPDAHSIEGPKLRVGALLRDAHGRALHVVRRKGNKDTLISPTNEPLPGKEASWVTAGVAANTFHSLFGLSFATLQSGADELLGSAGDLGQSLFSAAVGGGRVRLLLESLRAEADSLFKPRGRNQLLNEALNVFDAAKKQSKEQAMAATAFTEQQAAIDAAEAENAELHARSQALRAERERLERARRVMPLLAKQTELARQREALGAVTRLPLDAASLRRNSHTARREAALRIEHAQAEIVRHERELAALVLDPVLAAVAPDVIESLRDRLGGYRRSVRELPARKAALAREQDEVLRVLERLGMQDRAADVERLRVSKALEVRLREHVRQGDSLARSARDLQRAAAAKRDELAAQQRQLAQLWAAAGASAVRRAELPREEAVAAAEQAFTELAHAERLLTDKRSEVEAALERNLRDREAMAHAGAPPTEAELLQLRAARQGSWAGLRAQLSERTSSSWVEPLERAQALTEQADAMADRLRREATRVAEHARLLAEQQSAERTLEKLQRDAAELEQRSATRRSDWEALFSRAGVVARPPREVRNLLVEQRAYETRSEQLERELLQLERDLAANTERERVLRDAWQALSAELQVEALASAPELEALLEGRSELLRRFDQARTLERDIRELEAELRAFETDARSLCDTHLPELSERAPDTAADHLIRAHQAAQSALAAQQQLSAALTARRSEAETASAAFARAERDLMQLMEAAGVSDLLQLEAAEARSNKASELDAALAQLDNELLVASDGLEPAQAIAAVNGTLDEVRAKLAEVEDEIEELNGNRQRVAQTLAGCRAGLERMRENHGAGDAALEAASQLEVVRAHAERYVQVRLAASILKREIDRYRERHRAPILQSAGELFAQLTLSAYTGLDVDYGADDEPTLSCVRAGGGHIDITALSTGTRDQLYLALRLATIAHLASQQELMPLILDDILIHFDDDRARAALKVLGDFTSTTQVLFFTHHRRLCELAKEALPAQRLRLHELTPAPTTTTKPTQDSLFP